MGELTKESKQDEGLRRLKDGSLVEGLAPGGKVLIIRNEPSFKRDIIPYFSGSIMIVVAMVMVITTNRFYLPVFFVFLVSPLVNYLGQGDNKNVSQVSTKAFQTDKRFDIPLHFYVFFEFFVWIWSLMVISEDVNPKGWLFNFQKPQTYSDYFGFVLVTGLFSSIGSVVGHELIHHRETHNKVIGFMTFVRNFVCQFVDEHIKGHHKWVSTLEDPATSRKNETLYFFILRSIIGSRINVWGYEIAKITKKYGQDCNFLYRIFYNRMFWYEFCHVAVQTAVYYFFGWEALKLSVCQGATGLFLIETINYIEHYGILRKKDKNGVYESIGKMHSWNYLSGAVMIRIQRHSDHHAHSFRPYQILRRQDDAPHLAFEYLQTYFIAAIPPLWFYIMNPRVEALDDIKNDRPNIAKSQWNNIMPATAEDKKRFCVAYAALGLLQVILAYLCFF